MSWRDERIRGLTKRVLGRFPEHFEAGTRGKRLGRLADVLAEDLERLSVAMAQIRRSRRPEQVDELLDLARLGDLHGYGEGELQALDMRAPSFRLALAARRARLLDLAFAHAGGNGTVASLLAGAASALDLERLDRADGEAHATPVISSADRFWHGVWTWDRFEAWQAESEQEPVDALDLDALVLEENPAEDQSSAPAPRRHGELWSFHRDGFGDVPTDVRVRGEGERTLGALLMQRETGRGVGYLDPVAEDETLVLTRDGRAEIEKSGVPPADVSSRAFAVSGGCFSETGEPDSVAWHFAGDEDEPPARAARFAVSTEAGDGTGTALQLPVGTTHLAFFVRRRALVVGEDGGAQPPAEGLEAFYALRFDAAGFAAEPAAPGSAAASSEPIAAHVSLAWAQRRPFVVRLRLPARLRRLERDERQLPAAVLRSLHRFRPAGVDVEVVYADDEGVSPPPQDFLEALNAAKPSLENL